MILASKSPRRKELLGVITKDFRIIPAVGEEKIPDGTAPRDAVILLAKQKAEEIAALHSSEVIVAADTIVVIDNIILGKPRDKAHAAEMLKTLSGRVHTVYTGVCVIFENGKSESFADKTDVEFYPLSEREISDYIATGEPMDKAGAYGIQEQGALLVKRIDGDFYNVMGLPIARLSRVLKNQKIAEPQIVKISETDIPECVRLIRRSFLTVAKDFGFTAEKDPKFTAFSVTDETLSRQLITERRPIFAYTIGGKIAGYYSLKLEEKSAELCNLCTDPEFRHGKIGEAMLNHSFNTAKELGIAELKICVVDANERVKRWYTAHGFKNTGVYDSYYPFPCVFMTKSL